MTKPKAYPDLASSAISPTRQEYLDGTVTFEQFYTAIVQDAGIAFPDYLLSEVISALAKGDEHLNTIALRRWDVLAACAKSAIAPAFKRHGDYFSLAGGVCVMKQAAYIAAKKAKESK